MLFHYLHNRTVFQKIIVVTFFEPLFDGVESQHTAFFFQLFQTHGKLMWNYII